MQKLKVMRTALEAAFLKQRYRILQLLLKHGAEVNMLPASLRQSEKMAQLLHERDGSGLAQVVHSVGRTTDDESRSMPMSAAP